MVFALEQYRSQPDTVLLGVAVEEQRILLTEDNDFGELVFRRIGRFALPGLVLLRIASERRQTKWARLFEAIRDYGDRMTGHFTVVGESRVRLRAIPPIA